MRKGIHIPNQGKSSYYSWKLFNTDTEAEKAEVEKKRREFAKRHPGKK